MNSKCKFHQMVLVEARRRTQSTDELLYECRICGKQKNRKRKRPPMMSRLKSGRISGQSVKKRAWNQKYRALHALDLPVQACAKSGLSYRREELERHHPMGRAGGNIMFYVYVTPEFHRWIHANPRLAYEQGWLQPEYRAMPGTGGHPKPWLHLPRR